ncbi:MAG: LLM class flavin-dependent oxidoreductase [Chloroflexi bacterium]|nr:LLM class flavin-dependent oxidoreductase [Chloroflexota bacterium]
MASGRGRVDRLALSRSNMSRLPPSRLAALARSAEEHGFRHLVFNESYNDVIAYLVAAASATDRATLYSTVANVGFRHPALMALGAAVVDDVSDGRFVLGLGTGTQWFTPERLDTLEARPLGYLREYVAAVRELISGEPVDRSDTRFRLADFQLSFRPRRAKLPIYLAAVGPKMTELAGEIADGVFANMASPEDVPEVRRRVARGCERAGRDPSSVRLAVHLRLSLDEDVDRAREAIRATLPAYLNFDGYGRHLASLGYEAAVSQVRSLVRAGDQPAATRAVPDELVDRVAAYGPAERIWTRIEQLLAANVDLIVLAPRLGHLPWDEAYEQVVGVLGAPRR